MGGSNVLGLLFEIAADPSKAVAAIDSLRAKVGQTGQTVEQANQQIAASAVSSAARRAIEVDRKLYAQHKISGAQMVTEEKEYTATMVALRDGMWARMGQADAKNLATRLAHAEEAHRKELASEKRYAEAMAHLRSQLQKTADQHAKMAQDFGLYFEQGHRPFRGTHSPGSERPCLWRSERSLSLCGYGQGSHGPRAQ